MKKIGIKILMSVAFVLSVSIVSAQDGLTPTTPATKSLGAAHLIKVNATGTPPTYTHAAGHDGNVYTWEVLNKVGETDASSKVSFLQTDLSTALASTSAANLFVVGIQWNTPGEYIIQVTEENQQTGQGNCTTRRRFYVTVTNQIDVQLLALASNDISDVINLPADVAKLTDCSDGSGGIIDNVTNDFGTTTRYYRVNLNTGSTYVPDWSFDFTVGATSADVKSISVDGASLATFSDGDTSGTINVGAGKSSVLVAVEMKNTAGTLQTLAFSIDDESAKLTSGGTEYTEPLANNGNNSVTGFTVNPMPNTSVISLD